LVYFSPLGILCQQKSGNPAGYLFPRHFLEGGSGPVGGLIVVVGKRDQVVRRHSQRRHDDVTLVFCLSTNFVNIYKFMNVYNMLMNI
jgi:hypothetical protein